MHLQLFCPITVTQYSYDCSINFFHTIVFNDYNERFNILTSYYIPDLNVFIQNCHTYSLVKRQNTRNLKLDLMTQHVKFLRIWWWNKYEVHKIPRMDTTFERSPDSGQLWSLRSTVRRVTVEKHWFQVLLTTMSTRKCIGRDIVPLDHLVAADHESVSLPTEDSLPQWQV